MMELKQGLFIVFEGIDFCGKSTQARMLFRRITNLGYKYRYFREPGATEIGERIREILLYSENLPSLTKLLLFSAARDLNVKQNILPALINNEIVICDRFDASTRVYQVLCDKVMSLEQFEVLNQVVVPEVVKPDLCILIDTSVDEALRRRPQDGGEKLTTFDNEKKERYELIHFNYLRLAQNDKHINWVIIDGNRDIDTIHEEVWQHAEPLIQERSLKQ